MTNSGGYLTEEPPAFKRGANEELEGGPIGPTDPREPSHQDLEPESTLRVSFPFSLSPPKGGGEW
jgi:hypothetical protein